jgi:hypothetical protein
MSLPTECKEREAVPSPAPMELKVLARLELKKRQLLEELAEVESHYQQLKREIELKRMPIPWLTRS